VPNVTYGFTNIFEWTAELFAVRVLTNLRDGEAYAWCDDRIKPRLAHFLCGSDDTIYADMMQTFSELVPGLDDPSPWWGGLWWDDPPA
jgi:hypothetical protein